MSDFDRGIPRAVPAGAADMAVDAGLRGFMLGVYNKVALGLLWSAALAYLTSSVPAVRDLLFVVRPDGRFGGITMIGMAVGWSPLILLLVSGFAMRNPTARSAGMLYWSIVSLIGASLGMWVLIYTGASIATTFLIIGLVGIIIASIVNMWLHSPAIYFIVNLLGVGIFAGLIGYDTQRLKMTYYALGGDQAAMGVATNYGALSLYINFINLFQFLLQFVGVRR